MGFRRKILYQLVHFGSISNREARRLLELGAVKVSGITVTENVVVDETEAIEVNGIVLRPEKKFVALMFYKPRGFQSTLSSKVKDNISGFIGNYHDLSIAGRLDKDSEGLLLLGSDGKWVERIINPKYEKEKEYFVELNQDPDEPFFEKFRNGLDLGDYVTRPCICERWSERTIRVILTEGKNRQIRRMCGALGFRVRTLKRIRIGPYHLGNMKPGEIRVLNN